MNDNVNIFALVIYPKYNEVIHLRQIEDYCIQMNWNLDKQNIFKKRQDEDNLKNIINSGDTLICVGLKSFASLYNDLMYYLNKGIRVIILPEIIN